MTQNVAAHAALAAVPAGLTLGQRQKAANDNLRVAGAVVSANNVFDAWAKHGGGRTDTSLLGRMFVHRHRGVGLESVTAADNSTDAVVKHALKRGAEINADSQDARALVALAVPLTDGEQCIVVITEIGFRAAAALPLIGQPVVVFNVDDTHCLSQSVGERDALVLTLVVRICGVAVPLAHAVHYSATQTTFEAIFRVFDEHLGLNQLTHSIRVSFMSDDSDAQRNAIRTVFGQGVRVLQCIFHVFKRLRQHVVQYAALVQTGSDGTLVKVGPKQVYQFIRANTSCTTVQLQQILDDVCELVDGLQRKRILEERDSIINAINAKLTKHVNAKELKPKGHNHRRGRKKAAARAAAADDDVDDDGPPRAGDPLDGDNVTAPDSPLIHLVYDMIMASDAKEFQKKRRELSLQALLCGMGDFVYHYLFGSHGYLCDGKRDDIVFHKTKLDHWGDLTNNTSEQLHRVYADHMLQGRNRARGLLELVDMLITFQHTRVVQNLSQAVYGHADSSPYRKARSKSLALDRRVEAVPHSIKTRVWWSAWATSPCSSCPA